MSHGRLLAQAALLFWGVPFAFASPTGAPLSPSENLLLSKTALSISYSPRHKQADWVFYALGTDHLTNCTSRDNNFREDASLPADVRSQNADYKDSGYDRGHLSPAGDNKWSAKAMSDTFLLSNISPQEAHFNRGIWARLEELARAWAMKEGLLQISTGPVLQAETLPAVGGGQVSVPHYFYKVLYAPGSRKAIAFLMPQDADGKLESYAVNVDTLENYSRLDFMKDIREEDSLESRLEIRDWDFNAKSKYLPCPRLSWFQQ